MSPNARFEEGRFVHSRSVTRDVTGMVDLEQTLAQFASMVESADDSIIGKTLDGIVTYWNPAAERLYGYSREEMGGKAIVPLLPSELPDRGPHIPRPARRCGRG